jgi:hypothetical protein
MTQDVVWHTNELALRQQQIQLNLQGKEQQILQHRGPLVSHVITQDVVWHTNQLALRTQQVRLNLQVHGHTTLLVDTVPLCQCAHNPSVLPEPEVGSLP